MTILRAYHFEHGEDHGLANSAASPPTTDEVTSTGALGQSGFSRRFVYASSDNVELVEAAGTYTKAAATTAMLFGFRIKISDLSEFDEMNIGVEFDTSGTTALAGVVIGTNGSVTAYTGQSNWSNLDGGASIAGTGAGAITEGEEHYISMRVVASDTVGEFQVEIDGTEVINETNVDTVWPGFVTAQTPWGWGCYFSSASSVTGSPEIMLDDIVIARDEAAVMPPRQHHALLPDGDTADIDGTIFGGAATRWQALDENPATDVDGITLDAVNDRNGCTFEAWDAGANGDPDYVMVYAAMGDDAAGSETVEFDVNDGTTTDTTGTFGLGTDFSSTLVYGPDSDSPTGGGWDDTKVDAITVTVDRTV